MAHETVTSTTPLTLFTAHMANFQYVFKDGNYAVFKDGLYATSKTKYIKELEEEIAQDHPWITKNPNKLTITLEELDPMYEIRKQIREEERAKLIATTRDMGTSGGPGGTGTGNANSSVVQVASLGPNDTAARSGLGVVDLSGLSTSKK